MTQFPVMAVHHKELFQRRADALPYSLSTWHCPKFCHRRCIVPNSATALDDWRTLQFSSWLVPLPRRSSKTAEITRPPWVECQNSLNGGQKAIGSKAFTSDEHKPRDVIHCEINFTPFSLKAAVRYDEDTRPFSLSSTQTAADRRQSHGQET